MTQALHEYLVSEIQKYVNAYANIESGTIDAHLVKAKLEVLIDIISMVPYGHEEILNTLVSNKKKFRNDFHTLKPTIKALRAFLRANKIKNPQSHPGYW
jgi:hypothetical protein